MIIVSKIELINLEIARKNRSQHINHLSVQYKHMNSLMKEEETYCSCYARFILQ